MIQRILFAGLVAWGLGIAGNARAEDTDEEEKPRFRASRSAEDAQFLPLTLASRVDSQRAFVTTLGGYDSARASAILQGTSEINVWGPIAIRAGVVYTETTNTLQPTFGGHVQLLRQEKHGLDGSIAVFYKPEGFTEGEGEIEAALTVGRRFGRTGLYGNLVYGQDPEGAERDGEVRLAALYSLRENVHAGFDTRLRFDLGSSNTAQRLAKLEADYDLVAGPTASLSLGPFALIAQGGASLFKLSNASLQTGGIGLAGIGAVY
jgi:hypothetical protein